MKTVFGRILAILMLVWAVNLPAQAVVELGGINNDAGGVVNFGNTDGSNNEKVAMPLTLLNPAAISKVLVSLSKVGSPSDNVVVEMRQGSPDGILLASGSVPGPNITNIPGPKYEVAVPTFVVPSSTTICVVLSRSGSPSPGNFFFAIRGSSGSPYGSVTSGGYLYLKTGIGWGGSNLANSFIVSLWGTTVLLGQATVSPSSNIDFGNVNVGQTSPIQFRVKNTGTAVLTVSGLSSNNGQFTVAPVIPPNVGVNVGDSTMVTVSFTPTSTGSASGNITIVHNGVNNPTIVSVVGNGVSPVTPAPVIQVSVSSLVMDSTAVGSVSQKTFVVSNTGTAVLTFTPSLSGADTGQFAVTPSVGALVNPGNSQVVTVIFTPTSVGSKLAVISLANNALATPPQVSLSGRGFVSLAPAPIISVSVGSLVMDTTVVSFSSQKTFSITNTGTAELVVTSIVVSGLDAAQFSVLPSSATLVPGGSQIIAVTFAPVSVGSKLASLTLIHNAVTNPTVAALSGVGRLTPQPLATLSTLSLSFDSTTVSSFSQKSFTVANTGAAGLTVSNIALSGVDASQFAISPINFSVAAGASPRTVTVNFSPSSGGAKSASLVIAHNATGSPATVVLSGVGVILPPVTSAPSATPAGPSYAKPVVSISASTMFGEAPLEVQFVNNNTGGPIFWWEWQFINKTISGSPESVVLRSPLSEAGTITRTLADPGVYLVQLSVEGSGGGDTNTLKDSIVVVPPVPRVEVSVQSLVFAGQTVIWQGKQELSFEVSNPGKAQLVADMAISGTDSTDFTINPAHLNLARGEGPQEFKVVFQPTIAGPKTASIIISHNAASSPDTISLSGSAVLPADFNGDYEVNFWDFFLLADQFSILPITNRNSRYDLNGDRLVTHEDFYLFTEFFGR